MPVIFRRTRLSSRSRFEHQFVNMVPAALALCVIGSALAFGGTHVPVALAMCSLLAVVALSGAFLSGPRAWPTPSLVMGALGLYTLLQAAPLPIGVLERLSPRAADIWARALHPLGEPVTWASLSLDPGNTLVEAAKWFSYATTFALAAQVTRWRGTDWGVRLVFVSTLAVAAITLGHGLTGATRVYGEYEPSIFVSRWHIGPLLNPNNLAGYLNLGVMVGLGKALSEQGRTRWFWSLGAAFVFAVSLLSGSRGGIVSLALGLGVLGTILAIRAWRGRGVGLADWLALGLALAVALLFGVLGATEGTRTELFATNIEKLRIFEVVLPMIRDYAWFGVGRGAFESVFPEYTAHRNNLIYSHPENWVLQWMSEWGVPVTLLAGGALVWLFRPGRVEIKASVLRLSILLAVATWLADNLVDLGTELTAPSLVAALLLGVYASGRRSSDVQPGSRLAGIARWTGPIGAVLLVICTVLAWARGMNPVGEERERLQEQYSALGAHADDKSLAPLWGELRAAMLRHPAEAYFSRLGALLALRAGKDVMPWVQRSLERHLANGRTHWILAHALWHRKARNQALLEARLAVEYDESLAPTVGTVVSRWTQVSAEIQRAAPPGKAGAVMLEHASRDLNARGHRHAREDCLRLALERDPNYTPPRRALVGFLVRDVPKPAGLDPVRAEEAEKHLKVLERLEPGSAYSVQMSAELALQKGQASGVAPTLKKRCARLFELEKVRCFRSLVDLYARALPASSELLELAREILAFPGSELEEYSHLVHALGDLLVAAGLWQDAEAAYQVLLRDGPKPEALIKLARAAVKAGHLTVAERALERASWVARGDMRARVEAERTELVRSMPR